MRTPVATETPVSAGRPPGAEGWTRGHRDGVARDAGAEPDGLEVSSRSKRLRRRHFLATRRETQTPDGLRAGNVGDSPARLAAEKRPSQTPGTRRPAGTGSPTKACQRVPRCQLPGARGVPLGCTEKTQPPRTCPPNQPASESRGTTRHFPAHTELSTGPFTGAPLRPACLRHPPAPGSQAEPETDPGHLCPAGPPPRMRPVPHRGSPGGSHGNHSSPSPWGRPEDAGRRAQALGPLGSPWTTRPLPLPPVAPSATASLPARSPSLRGPHARPLAASPTVLSGRSGSLPPPGGLAWPRTQQAPDRRW